MSQRATRRASSADVDADEALDPLLQEIVDAENSGAWTLMHRYNKAADLIECALRQTCSSVLCTLSFALWMDGLPQTHGISNEADMTGSALHTADLCGRPMCLDSFVVAPCCCKAAAFCCCGVSA